MASFVYFTNTTAIVPLIAAAQRLAAAIVWLCLLLKLSCHVCVMSEKTQVASYMPNNSILSA
jgi:hypothetical protein